MGPLCVSGLLARGALGLLLVFVVPLDVGRGKHLSSEQVQPRVVVEVSAVGPQRVAGIVTFSADFPEVEAGGCAVVDRTPSESPCMFGAHGDGFGHTDPGTSVQQLDVEYTTVHVALGDERDLVGHGSWDVWGQSDVALAQVHLGELDRPDVDGAVMRHPVVFPLAHEGRMGIPADAGPPDQLWVIQLDGEDRAEAG